MAPQRLVSIDHRVLMDAIYRRQRHIYDATRKFFLFGRDPLIRGLQAEPGSTVLEIACGTGRNLALIEQHWRGCSRYGLDISVEMLKSARAKLGPQVHLACGNATGFEARTLFGQVDFDRVVISYALSMIPEWQSALTLAMRLIAPGGSLHIVDFGDLAGLPVPLQAALRRWLRHFHVTPRERLVETAASLAALHNLRFQTRRGQFGYWQTIIINRI